MLTAITWTPAEIAQGTKKYAVDRTLLGCDEDRQQRRRGEQEELSDVVPPGKADDPARIPGPLRRRLLEVPG